MCNWGLEKNDPVTYPNSHQSHKKSEQSKTSSDFVNHHFWRILFGNFGSLNSVYALQDFKGSSFEDLCDLDPKPT